MTDNPLNWRDILIHCAVAFPMAATCGAVAQMGWAYGGVLGAVLVVLGAAGGLGTALYWPVRERWQHEMGWGGRQSNWEWIGPVAVTPVGAIAGWWVSALLL